MYELAAAIVGPLIATFLAGFGVWLREWQNHRDEESRRQRALRRAGEEVAFIDSWIRAFDQVSEPSASERERVRAREDLERAYAVLAAARLPGAEGRGPAVVAERVRAPVAAGRVFGILLMFPLRSGLARGLSVVYYFFLLWAMLWTAAVSATTFAESAGPTDVLVGLILIVVVGLGPACLLGLLVWAVEHRVTRTRQRNGPAGMGMLPHGTYSPEMRHGPIGPNMGPPGAWPGASARTAPAPPAAEPGQARRQARP